MADAGVGGTRHPRRRECPRWTDGIDSDGGQGDAVAQYHVGFACAYGTSLPQDDALALAWYRQAAEQGLAAAQHHLGVMYANGEGTPQDFAETIMWLRRAAAQDYSTARYHLGVMYSNGDGVPGDEAEALAWFREAADEGEAPAQHMLGVLYADGADAPRASVRRARDSAPSISGRGRRPPNNVEAQKWFSLAASRVVDEEQRFYADIRDREAKKLTSEELADAQRLAQEWQAAFEQRQTESLSLP